jgi:voltage-gated potassium channel
MTDGSAMTDSDAATGDGTATAHPAHEETSELKGTGYELFVLLVSLLSIANTLIVLLPVSAPIQQVAVLVDLMIVPVFLVDFLYRLRTARSRRVYLVRHFGWADMLSIIPALGVFRTFRVVRSIRLLRRRGPEQMAMDVDRGRAQATFLITVFLVLIVVEFAGMAIFLVESANPDSNIKNASDAIWWGFVTVTTVGYGDRYPITDAGRVIGTILLFAGIALFSVLTGFIANGFLAPRSPDRRLIRAPKDSLEADVEELRWMLVEQEERAAAIRRKLDDIERRARDRARRLGVG